MFDLIKSFNNPFYTGLCYLVTLTMFLVNVYKQLVDKEIQVKHRLFFHKMIDLLKSLDLNTVLNNTFIKIEYLLCLLLKRPRKYILSDSVFWEQKNFLFYIFIGLLPNLVFGFKNLAVYFTGPFQMFTGYFIHSDIFEKDKEKNIKSKPRNKSYNDNFQMNGFLLFILVSLSCSIYSIPLVIYIILKISRLLSIVPPELSIDIFKLGIAGFLISQHAAIYSAYCLIAVYCLAITRIFIHQMIVSRLATKIFHMLLFFIKMIGFIFAILFLVFRMNNTIIQKTALLINPVSYHLSVTYLIVAAAIPAISFIIPLILMLYYLVVKIVLIPVKALFQFVFEYSLKKDIIIFVLSLILILLLEYVLMKLKIISV